MGASSNSNNYVEHVRGSISASLQEVNEAGVRCKEAFHAFVAPRLASQPPNGKVDVDTQVRYQNAVRPVSELLAAHFAIDFEKGYGDAAALLLLRKAVNGANAAIANAWFGHDGILVNATKALFWHTTDSTNIHEVVARLTQHAPDYAETFFFVKHDLGLCVDAFASHALSYVMSFRNGLLPSLMQGGIDLLSLYSFTAETPAPNSLPRRTLKRALAAVNLFHVWEIHYAIAEHGVYSEPEAKDRDVNVFRFDRVFEEMHFVNALLV